jgi:hypothetical protein
MENAGTQAKRRFSPGSYVPGVGLVDTNHCGLPWPAYMSQSGPPYDAGCFYGVVLVAGIACDAATGGRLTPEQLNERKNNLAFDYK